MNKDTTDKSKEPQKCGCMGHDCLDSNCDCKDTECRCKAHDKKEKDAHMCMCGNSSCACSEDSATTSNSDNKPINA